MAQDTDSAGQPQGQPQRQPGGCATWLGNMPGECRSWNCSGLSTVSVQCCLAARCSGAACLCLPQPGPAQVPLSARIRPCTPPEQMHAACQPPWQLQLAAAGGGHGDSNTSIGPARYVTPSNGRAGQVTIPALLVDGHAVALAIKLGGCSAAALLPGWMHQLRLRRPARFRYKRDT